MMRWKIHSERTLLEDPWVHVSCADVELPDGRHLDHRLIRTPAGAGAVIVEQGQVLLMWRHRFITDSWGWEIPIGRINPGETPAEAAARETEEETGWRPGLLQPLVYTQPSPGLMTSQHHIYRANSATHIGEPEDRHESERIAWVPLDQIPDLINSRDISSGTTLVALLHVLAIPQQR